MKYFLGFVFACFAMVSLMAQDALDALVAPMQEEEPYQVIIEDDVEASAAEDSADVELSETSINQDDKDAFDIVEAGPEETTEVAEETVAEDAEATTSEAASVVEDKVVTTTPKVTPIVIFDDVDEGPDPEPNCGHSLRPPRGFDQEVLMLQIFLDRHNFSCGVIDGVWGKGSREAMRAWQATNGRRRTQWIDPTLYGELATMFEAILSYTVTEEDIALVTGPSPATWAERSKLPLMGYESIAACLAEKFHTSERTLHYLNPGIMNWATDVKLGTTLRVPNVRQAALTPVTRVVIVLDDCLLLGFDAEGLMRLRFPCSIARRRAHLPEAGNVTIKNMAPAPNYTYDPANYGQDPSVGKMIIPPGPRNPVGSRWIGLSLPGYGIHGTPKPNTIGRPESRGCFRLANWNAEKLFELVKPGVQVEIVQSLRDVANQRKTVEMPVEAETVIDASERPNE
ncbi:MAG: L,D-transpeptidase [bacterium]|nr:L,D-transpeptidase [bacterium]